MAAPVVAPSIVTVAASVVAPSPPVTAKVINFVPVTNACVPAAASVCAPGLTVKLLNEASCANVAAAAFTVTVSANTAPLTPTPPATFREPVVFELEAVVAKTSMVSALTWPLTPTPPVTITDPLVLESEVDVAVSNFITDVDPCLKVNAAA